MSTDNKREIKFRAWDSKKMIYDVVPFPIIGTYTGEKSYRDARTGLETPHVMQFTGLNDWYEGDIIRGNYGAQGQTAGDELVGQIKYRTGEFYIDFNIKSVRIYSVDGNGNYLWKEDANFASDKRFYYYQITGLTKIGNIYENPELLTNV